MSLSVHRIAIKKKYGQHFLRNQAILDEIVSYIALDTSTSVLEIGCGDGALSTMILQKPVKRLWVFEIDKDWVDYLQKNLPDKRLTIYHENILDIKPSNLQAHAPWIVLANLPYQITFPILYLMQRNRTLFKEGVIMVQDEVAQKILKTSGRGYGYSSLFFSYYFSWKSLSKVPPSAFLPSPKVNSRLLYFKSIQNPEPIINEDTFWKFIKLCFHQPRRTLRNNLMQTHIDCALLDQTILDLRAQQLQFSDFIRIWGSLQST